MAGVRGTINEVWCYDVSARYSSDSANTTTLNYFVTPRSARALDVVDVGGVPTCQSVIDGTDLACIPWNPFVPGGVTQAQLAFRQATGLQIGRISQEDLGQHSQRHIDAVATQMNQRPRKTLGFRDPTDTLAPVLR